MRIRKIDTTDRGDARRFVDFPFELYRDHACWVPPLVSGVQTALDRSQHPFYHHSAADFFLAEEGDRTLGRIAALVNRRYNDFHDARTAFFYYFDTVDDESVAHSLLDAACQWARDAGMDKILGPKGFLRADGIGLLVEGFEHRAAPGMPYNYAYYGPYVASAGFEKEIDYDSAYLSGDYQLPERFDRVADRVRQRGKFWIKSFKSKRELRAWIPKIQRVNNEAFTQVWGYYPIDDAETAMIGKQLLAISIPRLLKLVMYEDEVAGFVFMFPDVAEGLQKARGRLWPVGWVHLLRAFQTTRRLSGNGVGLLPEYQGLGANALLYTELYRTVREWRDVEFCDLAQVAETNAKSLGEMAAAGVHWYKKHRVYRTAL
ncbi:MAG: hypothetical protein JXB35_03125 [Anaerolineae bacterium]|nr:hypothetical protein [Anaerolineae bacterium]